MIVSNYIFVFLVSICIIDAFGITGWGSMTLDDACHRKMKFWCCRNEATAPMMAEGYARSTGKPCAVVLTAGPGSSNSVPGLSEAFVDGAPIFIVSGQVPTKHFSSHRSFGTAGIDIISIVQPLTKFCVTVHEPELIKFYLEKAYWFMLEGHPGPVWLDIPFNVQQAEVPNEMDSFQPPKLEKSSQSIDYESIISLFNKAKSPLLLVGHGVRISKAEKEVCQLIQSLQLPFVVTRFMNDFLPFSHKLNMGLVGIKGKKYNKALMQSADTILVLGSSLPPTVIGENGEFINPKAKIIRVDISDDQRLDIFIKSDIKEFIKGLPQNQIKPAPEIWIDYCQQLKREHAEFVTDDMKKNPMDLYRFMKTLDGHLNQDMIVTTEAGGNYYSSGQVFEFNQGAKELTSVSFAAMGVSLPLAIGASVGNPSKSVVAIVGDGGLELNIQELKTISFEHLNIKIFVLENNGYTSMVKWQQEYFEGRLIEKPGQNSLDLEQIAKAFNLSYCNLNNHKTLDQDLINILSKKGPLFIEVTINPNGGIMTPLENISLFSK